VNDHVRCGGRPEYQALGPVIDANLVSPEFEITYAPTILGYLNGVTSLVRYGLTSCEGGFGLPLRLQMRTGGLTSRYCGSPTRLMNWPSLDGQSLDLVPLKGSLDGGTSDGMLSFRPRSPTMNPAEIVAELDLLLTAGRLSDVSRAVIEREYVRVRDNYTYFFANQDGTNCSTYGGEIITTVEECEEAARALPKADKTATAGSWNWKPIGCYYDNSNPEQLKVNTGTSNPNFCTGTNDCVCRKNGTELALKRAIELFLATPDFAVTNLAQPSSTPRVQAARPASGGRAFKALVVVFLLGGSDSWSMLVPYSGCTMGNMTANYDTYMNMRGGVTEGVALSFNELLPIDVGPSQPCSQLGVHPRLSTVRRLYNEGDVAFLTNVGALVEPMTKAEYLSSQRQRPPSLFAHNVQQKVCQSMHPQDNVATGVLGRIVDVINRNNAGTAAFRTGKYSLAGMAKMLEGEDPPIVLDRSGVVAFEHQTELEEALGNITLGGGSFKSTFGETWAQNLKDSLSISQTLATATAGVTLTASFGGDALGQQMEQASRAAAVDAPLPHPLCRRRVLTASSRSRRVSGRPRA
jgi:hypothetical protein